MVVDRHPNRHLPAATGRPVGEGLPVDGDFAVGWERSELQNASDWIIIFSAAQHSLHRQQVRSTK